MIVMMMVAVAVVKVNTTVTMTMTMATVIMNRTLVGFIYEFDIVEIHHSGRQPSPCCVSCVCVCVCVLCTSRVPDQNGVSQV